MGEEVALLDEADEVHDVLPFRLNDISPIIAFSGIHPMAEPIDKIQSEIRFQTKLAVREWNSEYWITLALGLAGFLLGAISPELLSGGDPLQTGYDGLTSVVGVAFFQMLLSLICWGIFAMQVWRLFQSCAFTQSHCWCFGISPCFHKSCFMKNTLTSRPAPYLET
jgi:hypothetical protein